VGSAKELPSDGGFERELRRDWPRRAAPAPSLHLPQLPRGAAAHGLPRRSDAYSGILAARHRGRATAAVM